MLIRTVRVGESARAQNSTAMNVDQFMGKAMPRFETKATQEITDLFFLFVQNDKELMKDYLDTVAQTGDLQTVNREISRRLAKELQVVSTGVKNDNPHSNLIQSYSERSK